MRGSCDAILIVCTSLDSQRRAVLKWEPSRSCQGRVSFILVCVILHRAKVLCVSLFIFWELCGTRMRSLILSAVCNMLLGVSVVLYITVSNMDKLAQKLC